jgi:hypothetical protein
MAGPRVATFLVLLMVAGCHDDAGKTVHWPAPVQKPPPPAKKGPSAQEQTAGMVAAASPGKSALAVAMKFELLSPPAVGQPLAIDIALLPQLSASAGTLQVVESGGMDLAPGAAQVEIPPIEPDQVYRTRLVVTPRREGILFLSMAVTVTHDEITETRAFSLPIIVSGAAAITAAGH